MTPPAEAATRVLRLVRPVRSLEAAARFYCDALGLAVDAGPAAPAGGLVLHAGPQPLELVQADPGTPATPIDQGSTDVRFQHIALVTADMAAAVARLRVHAPSLVCLGEAAPQALAGAAAGITAFKFRDPDGHPVELLAFTPAAVPPAWRTAAATPGAGLLGWDHCALSVADVERSIRFYRDVLGLRLLSRQVNEGPAQARLDGLPQARVDVVALCARHTTPHVELLRYRAVRRGVTAPRSALADTMVIEVGDAVLQRAQALAGASAQRLDGSETLETEDPDGHRLRLVKPAAPAG